VCVKYCEEVGISDTVDNFNVLELEISWNIILGAYIHLYKYTNLTYN
jgi:hypothetical protein